MRSAIIEKRIKGECKKAKLIIFLVNRFDGFDALGTGPRAQGQTNHRYILRRASGGGPTVPTGSVRFGDQSGVQATVPLTSAGASSATASFTTSQLGFVTEAEFDRVVDPAKMVHPYVAKAS